MLGRTEHVGIVTLANSWHYDTKFTMNGDGRDSLWANWLSTTSDWLERPVPGDRVAYIHCCNESGSTDPRVWLFRDDKPVLALTDFAYGREWKDDAEQRTERLLSWRCPICGDALDGMQPHDCGMDGGMP